jgi:aminoglycoside 6'-N-acetyltransferase
VSIGPAIKGDRVTIRDMEPEDVGSILELRRRPEIVKWWGQGEKWPADMGPDDQMLTIEVDGELAGYLEVYEEYDDPDWRFATLDIFVSPDLIGKGFGTEALRLAIGYLTDSRGHHRITIDPAIDNEIAIRSYTKLGFKPVGTMHKYWRDGSGKWRDSLLLELIIESNL